MDTKVVWLKSISTVMILGILLAGCAAMQKSETMDTERILAASGFKMVPMDTPKQLEHVKSLTQGKIIPHEYKGSYRYVYADATHCKCMYVGNDKAFHSFWRTVNKKNNEEVDWGISGPLMGPGGG